MKQILIGTIFLGIFLGILFGINDWNNSKIFYSEYEKEEFLNYDNFSFVGSRIYFKEYITPYFGNVIRWYSNNSDAIQSKGHYSNGLKDGKWEAWYENGKKKEEGIFKDGWWDGLFTSWYENGSIKLKYKGTPCGTSTIFFNEDGSIKDNAKNNDTKFMKEANDFARKRIGINGRVYSLNLDKRTDCTYYFSGSFYADRDGRNATPRLVWITVQWNGDWQVLDTKII